MSLNPFILKDGAIFIADAHYAPWRPPFFDFLRAVDKGEIQAAQLILMGDVFDLLFGDVDATLTLNHDAITLLNTLATRMEILYLEGNHDFRLQSVFPNIRVITRAHQPFNAVYNNQTIALSHGDTFMGFGYELYTAIIRNRVVLKVLNQLDQWRGNFIVKRLIVMMKGKHHCNAIENFSQLIHKRLNQYPGKKPDVLIEGHFHQNSSFEVLGRAYINLGAFACNERYYAVQSSHNTIVLKEAFLSKEPR